ncbi:MAG: hypothetical protein AAGD96_04480 [Chloroflexota bacterium]
MSSSLPEPILWQTENLLAAVEYAAKKLYFSVDRRNMNKRSLTESLDDKIMGEVATVAVVEYLRSVGFDAASYDQFRRDDFKRPDPGWDILFGHGVYRWVEVAQKTVDRPETIKTASVKSSRLPKGDDITAAILKRDFKIFCTPQKSLEVTLTADYEMQVYFDRERSWLNKSLSITADDVNTCIQQREKCQIVLEKLNIEQRYGSCFLTTWNKKEQILRDSAAFSRKTWTSFHAGHAKKMWVAPLKNGSSFEKMVPTAQSFTHN